MVVDAAVDAPVEPATTTATLEAEFDAASAAVDAVVEPATTATAAAAEFDAVALEEPVAPGVHGAAEEELADSSADFSATPAEPTFQHSTIEEGKSSNFFVETTVVTTTTTASEFERLYNETGALDKI